MTHPPSGSGFLTGSHDSGPPRPATPGPTAPAAPVRTALGRERAMHDAIVAIESTGGATGHVLGTGFFVAPDIVATCAHVVAAHADELPKRLTARIAGLGVRLDLEASPEHFHFAPDTGLDLAFLRVHDATGPYRDRSVLMASALDVGDALWAFGHPDNMFRAGQPATLVYEGASSRSFEAPHTVLRVRGTPLPGGFSGSPVLNLRTGCVAGMLSTSDKAGSAHMVPASDITARLDRVWTGSAAWSSSRRNWLRELDDAQVRAGRWPFLGPRLRDYLALVVRAARSHPYPGVVPGAVSPPLSAVYVQQQAVAHTAQGPLADEEARTPADALLDRHDDVVVLGGPGSGKSSLLRSWVGTLAERWNEEEIPAEVPVLLKAVDLAGNRPFASLVSDAVTGELSTVGMLSPLPPHLFASPPAPGVNWLVMIDGLDEIMDAEGRRAVLRKLDAVREQDPHSALFRFVLTSRPVSEFGETRDAPWRFRPYSLLPFDAQLLPGFARAWFTALGLPDPPAQAAAFLDDIGRAGVRALATVPLMATMLCQLHAGSRDGALPRGRTALYAAFVALLTDQQYGRQHHVLEQARSLADRYGTDAAEAAVGLTRRAPALLQDLALARHRGDTRSVGSLVTGWTGKLRPDELSPALWSTLCEEVLLRSGLLVRRSGDLEFIHQTLLEYLAARATVSDPHRDREAYRRIVGLRFLRAPAAPLPGAGDDPYLDFLMAEWSRRPSFGRTLRRWARELHGAQFVLGLLTDGCRLPRRVVVAASAKLARVAESGTSDPFDRIRAARSLAGAGFATGTELLIAFAGSDTFDTGFRLSAAESLADTDHPSAPALLHALAVSEAEPPSRIRAAERLCRLGDARGSTVLASIARSADVWAVDRLRAAEALDHGDPNLASAVLSELALDQASVAHLRSAAVETLSQLRPYTAATILASAAEDPTGPLPLRVRAVESLEWLGSRASFTTIARIAQDPAGELDLRLAAAEGLARRRDARAGNALVTLVQQAAGHPGIAVRAAESLALLGDARAGDALAALTGAADLPAHDRLTAALTLASLADLRAADCLHFLSADPSVDTSVRLHAAESLYRMGDDRALYPLTVIALHPSVGVGLQIRAAEPLDQFRSERASGALLNVARNPDLLDVMRLRAAELLVRLGRREAADPLAELAGSAFAPALRVRAAVALIEVAPDRAEKSLTAFVHDHELDDDERQLALTTLRDAFPAKARTLLPAIAADGAFSHALRVHAMDLAHGDAAPRTLTPYGELLSDPLAPLLIRLAAVGAVRRHGGTPARDLLAEQLARTPDSNAHLRARLVLNLAELVQRDAYELVRAFVGDAAVELGVRLALLDDVHRHRIGDTHRLLSRLSTDRSLASAPRRRAHWLLNRR